MHQVVLLDDHVRDLCRQRGERELRLLHEDVAGAACLVHVVRDSRSSRRRRRPRRARARSDVARMCCCRDRVATANESATTHDQTDREIAVSARIAAVTAPSRMARMRWGPKSMGVRVPCGVGVGKGGFGGGVAC